MTNTMNKNAVTQIPVDHRLVEIPDEPVELYKILKFEGIASSGGEAKAFVASGQVLVNHAVERQKRKKINSGDTIEFNNEKIFILLTMSEPENLELKPNAD